MGGERAAGYDPPMRSRLASLTLLVLAACGPQSVRVVMNAENNSGQSGLATLTALSAARTRVDLEIGPSNDPRAQAAHVHEGRCGQIGPVKAGLTELGADAKKGGRFTSSTEIAVGLAELQRGEFAINVHDARDFSLYVSCGEIQ